MGSSPAYERRTNGCLDDCPDSALLVAEAGTCYTRAAREISEPPAGSRPMTLRLAPNLSDYLLLFALALMWGAAFLLIKVAVATVPPFTIVACRLLIGTLLMLDVGQQCDRQAQRAQEAGGADDSREAAAINQRYAQQPRDHRDQTEQNDEVLDPHQSDSG